MHADAGTKAGILNIYEHTGDLKKPSELHYLSEHERDLFSRGFELYLQTHDHLVRKLHAPLHYGRAVFLLALVYYLSLATWLIGLVNNGIDQGRPVDWPVVWMWVAFISAINAVLIGYGLHLEMIGFHGRLNQSQRIVALIAIVALSIAILANILAPYLIDSSTTASTVFLQNAL